MAVNEFQVTNEFLLNIIEDALRNCNLKEVDAVHIEVLPHVPSGKTMFKFCIVRDLNESADQEFNIKTGDKLNLKFNITNGEKDV
ncbi:hypothetical protein HB839_13605 [Listeria sp. FSL L7-1699]|uniref:Uncharacterized protein n=1 Tax=Listeria farberi TaxID=2713500 RepID=A0ABR6SQL8_9LIST|nr:hypothetical protein [Listeria farberi]MBC1376563.1 hypothetical protein [Listeria farberi]